MIAVVSAVAVWLILMGLWAAEFPTWTDSTGSVNLGALVAAAVVFVLVAWSRRNKS